MKNTIENMLKERTRVHFKKYNYEENFILYEEYRVPVIWRYRADDVFENPLEYIDHKGNKRIDGEIWK